MIEIHRRRFIIRVLVIFCMVILGVTQLGCHEKGLTETSPEQQVMSREYVPVEETTAVMKEDQVVYEIMRKIYEDPMNRQHIFYPEVSGLRGELLQEYMNQSLRAVADDYAQSDKLLGLQMDYSVKLKDNDRLSVLFSAQGVDSDGHDIVIRESVNLDISSSNEIHLENLIKEDAASQNAFLELTERWNIQPLECMGVYFERDHIVFFEEGVTRENQVLDEFRVPNEEIFPLMREDFGLKPAS